MHAQPLTGAGPAPAGPARPAGPGARRGLLVTVVVVVGTALLLRVFVVGWYPVLSDSMAPTVASGDHVVVDRVTWRLGGPDRGDLVTFVSPEDGTALLKRVVAVGGDEVRIDDALLVVNGAVVDEPYVDHARIDATYFGPVRVPAGHVFVLGDNRFGSIDSRVFGPVDLEDVTGRVVHTLG
ncbi:signal peptidase I [Georgenia muralis]|uniref:Signal peptidase I n=1 Tax=Georgenia muralis TaxID=154117 RepID=A0A3N4ZN50_9MICO|nr:signal peptidase I [Georgenia muralis]RPF27138.1 signal peptidase I [Georgenia muralis]